MDERVRVGAVDELPPGKGKIVSIGGCEVAVYNVEGRYHATLSPEGRSRHQGGPVGEGGRASQADLWSCHLTNTTFDVTIEIAPAREPVEASLYTVEVRGNDVVLVRPVPSQRPRRRARRRQS
jgi:nitrite reductase/ring-hydroxylating ferredoxin subunit